MRFNIEFGNSVFSLPEKVLDVLSGASALEIKLLIYLAADKASRDSFSYEEASLALCAQPDEISDALKYLCDVGLVSDTKENVGARVTVRKKKTASGDVTVVKSGNDTPTYTGAEIEAIFAERAELGGLVDECQRILGKMLTLLEINRIIALADYYRLDKEYITTLCHFAAKNGKPSVPYVDKTARELYIQGIVTTGALEKKLKQIEDSSTLEGFVRRLFGLGERKLTSKESKFVEQWVQYEYPSDMIELAYEISVNNTGSPSMPYINKTLVNWREAGYKTTEEVVRSIDKYRQNKAENTTRRFSSGAGVDPLEEAILSSSINRVEKKIRENKN